MKRLRGVGLFEKIQKNTEWSELFFIGFSRQLNQDVITKIQNRTIGMVEDEYNANGNVLRIFIMICMSHTFYIRNNTMVIRT